MECVYHRLRDATCNLHWQCYIRFWLFVNKSDRTQVENTLLKVEPMLLHVDPKGVNVEAALIEVSYPASAFLIS